MMRILTLTLAILWGCIAHESGVVQRSGDTISLLTEHGRIARLVLPSEEVRPVARLEDHLIEVKGRRGIRGLYVQEFKVYEGLHGLSAWVGVLEPLGVQVAIHDGNSGGVYLLHPDSAEALSGYLGQPVLLEGYVEGPHVIRVMYYRVLVEPSKGSGAP